MSSSPMPSRVSGWTRRFVVEWGIALVGATAALLLIGFAAPGALGSFAAAGLVVTLVLFVVLWIATAQTLLSIALWFVPALLISVAWFLDVNPVFDWVTALVPFGMLLISFVPPVYRLWDALVVRTGLLLLHMTQNPADRLTDDAAETVRRGLVTAIRTAQEHSPSDWVADMAGIHQAAEDLPSDSLETGELRQATVRLVDAHSDFSEGDSAYAAATAAIRTYGEALDNFRSRSTTYRVATMRWGGELADRR
jgi:hypothetical protein